MTRPLLLSVSTAFAIATAFPAQSQSVSTQLEAYMSARESLGQFSGAVLVARNGRILLSKGYGYSDLAARTPNTADTQFRAASITKQFTAMGLLRLREAGRLSLDDSICSFVDDCPASWRPVTIAQLIHHSSGIPDYEEALDLASPRYIEVMQSPANLKWILDSARVKPLDFAPGAKFHYSNTGYVLLSQVIEKASGMKYPDFMKSQIFSPAGLEHTGILTPGPYRPGMAKGFTLDGEPPLNSIVAGIPLTKARTAPIPPIDFSGMHGDGGLYTTVGDLYKWARKLSDTTYLSKRLAAEYFAPTLDHVSQPQSEGYAFGWIIGSALGTRVRYHTGALPGFISRIEEYPDSGVVVIVMANGDFFRVTRIARDLAAAAMNLPYDVPRSHHVVKLDSADVAPLAGEYTLADGRKAVVTIGKRFLELEVPGRFTAGLLPENQSLFYAPFFEGTVRFTRDGLNNVVSLTMHYDGIDRVARKITPPS